MSGVQTSAQHFDRLAARYSELRASDATVDPVTQAVVELGRLEGCRVLDVGCGPGTSSSREEALERIRARAYSSFALMSDEEYEAGLAAAEAGLPAEVRYDLRLLNVLAVRP